MFCSKCGKEIEDGAKFCPGCGAAIKDTVGNKKNSEETVIKKKVTFRLL